MPQIRKYVQGLLLAAAASPAISYAMSCKLDPDNAIIFKEALGAALALPADIPDGTVIWESKQGSWAVVCEDDQKTATREPINIYINPANMNIGQGVRVGIRYKSQTYTQASGSISTGVNLYDGCSWIWVTCKDNYKTRLTLNFQVFIEKFGNIPANGQPTTATEYRVFQLDGKEGLNSEPNKNLNYFITGVNNIKFIPCLPELNITPSTINFHPVLASSAKIGEVADSANFRIDLLKNCRTPYTINAQFTPVAGTGSVIDKMLVPNQNTSVGIAITRQDTNQQIPFGSWFKLTELTTAGLIRTEFRADLIWRAPSVPGAFEASALIDLSFK